MKVKPISILVAALFSASAIAAGQSSQGSSSESKQPQAQSEQSQSPQSSAQSSQSGQGAELVKQAQEKLGAAGHDAGPSDGVMGPKTQAALKEFQQAKGIEASGELDQETLAALEIGTPEGSSASTGSSSSAGATSPSGSGSSSGASASPSSDSGSQPPSQPGATGKQQ